MERREGEREGGRERKKSNVIVFGSFGEVTVFR